MTAPNVVRADGTFDVWCPKVLALVGEIPFELRDRTHKIGLQRKRGKETVAPLDGSAIAGLRRLREQAANFAAANLQGLAGADPAMPQDLVNRAADTWRPLFAIADTATGRWPELAREVALKASAGAHTDIAPAVRLLVDIRKVFDAKRSDRILTSELIAALGEMDERPWARDGTGEGWLPRTKSPLPPS